MNEAQRENERHGDDKRWARDEVVEKWNEAAQERDVLSIGYMMMRGLDISLIGPDEMRTGGHRANKTAKTHPALLFPATNDVGEVTRVQAVRFRGKPLADGIVERFSPQFHPKITKGGGYDPVRFKALPNNTDDRILICEGPEDALTLRQVTGCETWASLSISCLKHMPVPEGRTAIVFTDRGSEDETLKACAKLADVGATVFIAQPPDGHKDVNDALRAGETNKITTVMDQAERVQSVYDTLPGGYIRNNNGWVCKIDNPDKNHNDPTNQTPICKGLKILGLARNRDGSGWGQLAEVEAPDGNVLRWVIPANALIGTSMEAMKVLADMGLRIAIKNEEGLRVLLGCWRPTTKYRSVDKLGWTSTEFTSFTIRDGSLISSVKSEPVTLADTVPISTVQMSGTLDGWKEEVGERARGNPLLMLAISTAFAGPLLEPMNEDGGGIHLVGESSRGKTTALRASVSVWGMLDLIETWRATSNGLEGRAAVANSTCLYLDEMSEVSAKEAGETSYMLGNGQGKARANRAGGARPISRWKVVFLSTGEIALGDKLAEGKIRKRAGRGRVLFTFRRQDRGVFVLFDVEFRQ